jgi:hypothetical protein
MIRKRKAVGEIVAALIILLIASVLGSYLLTIGLKSTNEKSVLIKEELQFEEKSSQERFTVIHAFKNGNIISLWIINYGKVDINIKSVYINGNQYNPNNNEVFTSQRKQFDIDASGVSPALDYDIIIVSERGVNVESKWTF